MFVVLGFINIAFFSLGLWGVFEFIFCLIISGIFCGIFILIVASKKRVVITDDVIQLYRLKHLFQIPINEITQISSENEFEKILIIKSKNDEIAMSGTTDFNPDQIKMIMRTLIRHKNLSPNIKIIDKLRWVY